MFINIQNIAWSKINNFTILKIPQFCREVAVAMIIVMNFVIGGFSWVATVWLQVFNYS